MDFTYDMEVIKTKPEWQLAWVMSEVMNNRAPIGWSKYIPHAQNILSTFDIKLKEGKEL